MLGNVDCIYFRNTLSCKLIYADTCKECVFYCTKQLQEQKKQATIKRLKKVNKYKKYVEKYGEQYLKENED